MNRGPEPSSVRQPNTGDDGLSNLLSGTQTLVYDPGNTRYIGSIKNPPTNSIFYEGFQSNMGTTILPPATLVLPAAVTRPTFWLIGDTGVTVFYLLSFLALAVFFYGIYRRFRVYWEGQEDPLPRFRNAFERITRSFETMGTHSNLTYQDLYSGIMHFCISWGFIVLFIATTILFLELDVARLLFGVSFFQGDFYLTFNILVDGLGMLFVVGTTMALIARYSPLRERVWGKHTSFEDDLFIWTFFVLAVGGYLQSGLGILGREFPSFEVTSYVGWSVASLLSLLGFTPELAQSMYAPAWWSHSIIALLWIAWLPFAKPFHMISSLLNLVFEDEKAGVRLTRVPEDTPPEEIGYTSIEDLSWKQQLDLDACTKCGRCTAVCPANSAGRPLDPRDVILDLKQHRDDLEAGDDELTIIGADDPSVIRRETMDACLSCMACMDACPVAIEHVPQFTEMQRRLVETGEMNENLQDVMMDIFQKGNSFGESARKRADWVEELDFEIQDAREESVEFLWYVGDYPSYDDRQQQVARSLATLFDEAEVDFGILFEDEKNAGNDVRRVGEEGLYEMLVEENIESFESVEFDKIVCTDPHAFNTFQNEYPDFDWEEKPTYHFTQVLEELLNEDRLPLTGDELNYTVTYHDPCHLGRFNDVYESPRNIIRATGCELYEMPRNRSSSFCCGGGGGGLWMDFDDEPKPSEERLREALEDTEAGQAIEKFVIACPMCGTMFEDGRKTGGFEDSIEIIDIAELVAEALATREVPA